MSGLEQRAELSGQLAGLAMVLAGSTRGEQLLATLANVDFAKIRVRQLAQANVETLAWPGSTPAPPAAGYTLALVTATS